MNGSQSNTDGSTVASIGFWPKSLLTSVLNQIGLISDAVKQSIDGTSTAAAVDFGEASGSDTINDKQMAEIARRLVVTFENAASGNILLQPNAPDDHTKLWIQTDPVTGVPTGSIKKWDEDASAWVDASEVARPYVPPERRRLFKQVAAGASTVNIDFEDIKTSKYYVVVTWTTQQADLSWNIAPASYPSAFGYFVTNRTSTQVTFQFYGVPTGGLTIDGFIEEITNSHS